MPPPTSGPTAERIIACLPQTRYGFTAAVRRPTHSNDNGIETWVQNYIETRPKNALSVAIGGAIASHAFVARSYRSTELR